MDAPMNERLNVEIKNLDDVRREVDVELSAAEAAKAFDEQLTAYAGRVKIKGFRPGCAPRDLVKRMFGTEIEHAVIDRLVPRLLDEALSSRGMPLAGVPAVREVRFAEGEPLRFKATLEVWPDFALPPYTGLKLRRPGGEVGPEDIDRSLEELRRKNAEYLPVEGRGAAAGDYAVVELQGRDAKTKRLRPAEQVVVLVGREGNDPDLEAHLRGLRPQEERTFTTVYPPDHKNRKLAGKTIDIRLKLVSLKEMKFPEVNDDFARQIGEFENLAGLKDKIRLELQEAKAKAVRRELAEAAVQAVIEQTTISLPPSVLEEETEAVLRGYAEQIGSRAVSREAVEALKMQAGAQAARNLRQHLVLRKIARLEGLEPTEEEVDQEIRTIAQAERVPPARAMESFREEGRRENLKASLLSRKVVDFLINRAIMD